MVHSRLQNVPIIVMGAKMHHFVMVQQMFLSRETDTAQIIFIAVPKAYTGEHSLFN